MNDIRLGALAVAGVTLPAGSAPTPRPDRSQPQNAPLRNAAASARLIQPEGLDRKSAPEVAASVADALAERHRLSAASIDESDVTQLIGSRQPTRHPNS